MEEFKILAIDPGTHKSGVAVLNSQGEIIFRKIITINEIKTEINNLILQFKPLFIVVGRGTGRLKFQEILAALPVKVVEFNEKFSTMEARKLYWELHPPTGLLKFIPRGLLLPPQPIDDLAASIIGRKFLNQNLKNH